MAIKISQTKPTSDEPGIDLSIDNGDLRALKEIQKKWGFKDIESLMKFAMAVLLKTENNNIYIDIGGAPNAISPSDDLVNSPENITTKQPNGENN